MNADTPRPRGAPLQFLAAIMVSWVAVRVAMLGGSPLFEAPRASAAQSAGGRFVETAASRPGPVRQGAVDRPGEGERQTAFSRGVLFSPLRVVDPGHGFPDSAPAPSVALTLEPATALPASETDGSRVTVPLRAVASTPDPAPMPTTEMPRLAARWSADSWLLVRGRGQGLTAAGGPSYGASQAGAVVRFALAPHFAPLPQAYLRATRATHGPAQSEIAVGLSLRPLERIPVRVQGEARLQRDAGSSRLRPALSLLSEVPPLRLPLRLDGELYAHAGFVGGQGATGFYDVQAVLDRPVGRTAGLEMRVGGGAWAGGQEGASRLDVGPRASLRLPVGAANSRIALDWRFRVAGKARPGSGPALTISAVF